MKLEGSYTFDAPRDVVWKALLDPDILAKTMPGCERLEQTGDNEYKGALKIKVGPVQGKFQGTVKLSELNEPDSYKMQVDGKGAPGFMKGTGQVQLEAQDSQTIMHYTGDAQVGGRIASVGQRLLDSSAKALTRQSLDSLSKLIQARAQPETSAEPAEEADTPSPTPARQAVMPELEAPSQTEFAIGVASQVLDDLISHEKRMLLLAGALGVLTLIIVLNWWSNRWAQKVADLVWERRYQ